MTELPCLIFDPDMHLCGISGQSQFRFDTGDPTVVRNRFLRSLRSGDRKRFTEYCAASVPADSPSVPCELFSPIGVPPFRYAFCEKNLYGGRCYTMVFLAEDIRQFYHLMSPVSLAYSRTTDRIIREILRIAGSPVTDAASFTPETVLALRYFPTALRSLLEPGGGKGLCDVSRITELILQNLAGSPLFLNTEIRFSSRDSRSDAAHTTIIELSSKLYVHILTSVLTAMASFSADHVITLDVSPFLLFLDNEPLAVEVSLSTKVRDAGAFRNDCGTLRSLADTGSADETMLSAASVLAAAAGIETSVNIDYSAQRMNIYLTINPASGIGIPGFKYRDPYRSVGAVVTDFFRFIESL